MVHITYQELRDFLHTLTDEQLAQPATVYAGDVDDAIPVFGTCVNTDDEMGESMEGYSTDQVFMQI